MRYFHSSRGRAAQLFVCTCPCRGFDPRSTLLGRVNTSWRSLWRTTMVDGYQGSGFMTIGRHDTDTRPLVELEAHRSHRSPSFMSGVRASLTPAGAILFSHPFHRRLSLYSSPSEPIHLCTRRRRPLHCGSVSRARRHTGTIISPTHDLIPIPPKDPPVFWTLHNPPKSHRCLAFVY